MDSIRWKIPELSDFRFLRDNLYTSNLSGSDTSIVNLWLLQKKYDIHISVTDSIFFRYYTGSINRTGYGFPVRLNSAGDDYLKNALKLIFEDAESYGRKVNFCLLTSEQKDQIQKCLEENFPSKSIQWKTERDDCDYIYDREKLSLLAGKTYHKKKNHLSRFKRTYDGRWEFRSLNLCNISHDIIKVAEAWAKEHDAASDRILTMEEESIKYAVTNKDVFAIEGGVLYIDSIPVAMTLASRISGTVLDIHYEKCLKEAADNGAYAAINQCFAASCTDYKYLNREEDMGVEGLRKAKLSYHPQILLEKFYGEVK